MSAAKITDQYDGIVHIGSIWSLEEYGVTPYQVLVTNIEIKDFRISVEQKQSIPMPIIHYVNLGSQQRNQMSYARFTYIGREVAT